MNSTPNYGYETKISAISAIDRDLKRVEDKVNSTAESTASVLTQHAERITRNEGRIECFSKCKSDNYSKCETDKLLEGKVDKQDGCRLICENELQTISDALADRYTKEKLYTQKEVDDLLAEKVNTTIPHEYDLEFINGFSARSGKNSYYINPFREVTLTFYFHLGGTEDDIVGGVFAQLPEGFRPSQIVHFTLCGITTNWARLAGPCNLGPDGTLTTTIGTPVNRIVGSVTFLANQ